MLIRDLSEERSVSEQLDALEKDCPQIADTWRALGWLLARTPEKGLVIDDKRPTMRVYRVSTFPPLPDIVVAYTFDDKVVSFFAIRMVRKGQ